MSRKQVLDLDSLDSPVISANPFGSILGVAPGSALAERIFNDPNSWQGADDDDDLKDAEAMKWLADEVGKCRVNGEELNLSPVDRDVDIMLKSLTERLNYAAPPASEKQANWDTIAQENKLPFLPLFDRTSLDLSLKVDLQFSKIRDAKGKMLHSPQSLIESKTLPPLRLAAPPSLDLDVAENNLSPVASPLTVASTSTTWSILEWYDVHPNTPRIHGRVPLLTHYPPTPSHAKPPALLSLRELSSPSANATVTKPPSPLNIPEYMPIRRLPIIPDRVPTTPSPTPSRPLTSRGGSLERTPRRTKPPDDPLHYVKTHQRSASASVTPSGSNPILRRKPRGSATLPAPSGSPDPFNSIPNVTSIRSGTLFTRSPPAGPRPRSGPNPMRQRQASGCDSPPPIVIEPVHTPTRARKPSSPPDLRRGMPA